MSRRHKVPPTASTQQGDNTADWTAPSLIRRLAAMLYDWVLLLGVLMIAVMLLIIPYQQLTGTPYPHGEPWHRLLLQLYLGLVICGFHVYFWTHGGQTLGMRAWRFRLVRADGSALETADAWRRILWAALGVMPAGLGLWWCLFDSDGLAWYDRRSGTYPARTS